METPNRLGRVLHDVVIDVEIRVIIILLFIFLIVLVVAEFGSMDASFSISILIDRSCLLISQYLIPQQFCVNQLFLGNPAKSHIPEHHFPPILNALPLPRLEVMGQLNTTLLSVDESLDPRAWSIPFQMSLVGELL